MQVTFKGLKVNIRICHQSFSEPRDAYTDSYVESACYLDGQDLTEAEIEQLTAQLLDDGTMVEDWTDAAIGRAEDAYDRMLDR
jgi:hypothetical protein